MGEWIRKLIGSSKFRIAVAVLFSVSACFAVYTWRFPNLLQYPNFYAEDGSIFYQNLANKGLWNSIWTPFNGYFIAGLYLLAALAELINGIFGNIANLPFTYSAISIAFLSLVTILPFFLFRKTLGHWQMAAVVIFSLLMPLPQSLSVVIGNLGNQKFTFFYLAFLLIVYRILNWRDIGLKKTLLIDFVILICIYTNSAVYALLPLIALPYVLEIGGNIKFRNPMKTLFKPLRVHLRSHVFLSMIGIFILAIPQLIYIAMHGIPELPGYLDSSYKPERTIEVFGNRTVLFGFTHLINGYLGDLKVITLLLLLAGCVCWAVRGRTLLVFAVSVYAALIASILFVINRPGVTDFFFGYKPSGSGPDQFFFAQTLIMYFGLVPIIFALAAKISNRVYRYISLSIVVAIVVLMGLVSNKIFGSPMRYSGIYENYNMTFQDQVIIACSNPKKFIMVSAYAPGGHQNQFMMKFNEKDLCINALKSKNPSADYLPLAPSGNNFRTVTNIGQIKQQIYPNYDNLSGIKIFLSNFDKRERNSQYQLVIFDKQCKKKLRSVTLPKRSLDSSFYRANFEPIPDSKHKYYCLSLAPPAISNYDPLAVQLSAPGLYDPPLLLEGKLSEYDIVFDLLYENN
jgi:hypothetical protein